MPLPIQEALNRYDFAREKLRKHSPNAWGEVIKLCNALPEQIDLQAFWFHGKDKPCWSNIRINVGNRISADLIGVQDFDFYETIASDAWSVSMLNAGRKWKANSNFKIVGESVRTYMNGLEPGGLCSYKWRLYAIREFASSLCREDGCLPMIQSLVERVNAMNGLNPDEIYPWAKRFSTLVGRGWGATTVNHMLTDLGLSVKPDLHLRRSVVRLGLLGQRVPSDLPEIDINRRETELSPMVVNALVHLSREIQPMASPDKPTSVLREIDKVLMECSRLNLLQAWRD